MFQCTFITCMGKGILPLRYNDIKKLRVKILLWMETVTHMSYWCSHFIDLVVKEHAHKTSESLILFYEEMSGKSGQPSGDSRRAFGHCRKTHREHSESLRVILGEYSEIVVKRILTTRGFRDVSRFWNSGGWQVCIPFIANVFSCKKKEAVILCVDVNIFNPSSHGMKFIGYFKLGKISRGLQKTRKEFASLIELWKICFET